MTERYESTGQFDYDPVAELPDGPEISCLEEMVGPLEQPLNGGVTYIKRPRYMPIGMVTDAAGATTILLGLQRLEPVPSGQMVGKWWMERSKAGRYHICYILDMHLRQAMIATMAPDELLQTDPETIKLGQGEFCRVIKTRAAQPFIHRNHIKIQDLKDRFDLPCIPVGS